MVRRLLWMAAIYAVSVLALGAFALAMHMLMAAAGLTS
jgi:hypothetical protein